MKAHILFALFLVSVPSSLALAAPDLRPDTVHTADGKKTQAYIKDGLIVGGDKAISDVVVRDIRRAMNKGGFERIVIDLQGNRNGEEAAIERPPFYQVAVTPDEKRMIVTIWGKPKLAFDAKKVTEAFKKSPVIEKLVLFPLLEDNSWTFAFELKSGTPVEVFELNNPVRVILDVKAPKLSRK